MEMMAFSIAESTDIGAFARSCGGKVEASTPREIFLFMGKNSWASVYNYGAIVFCNVSAHETEKLLELMRVHSENIHHQSLSEDHTIEIRGGKPKFAPSRLTIKSLNARIARVVMQNLAYSVTLDHYRRVSGNLLGQTNEQIRDLESRGKMKLGARKLNKFIGRVLNIKNRIAEHLYLFGHLDITWEDDELTAIHLGTADSLEIKTRFDEVNNSLRIVEENLHMFNEFHMHGQSYRIEVIITLLIVIEVLDLIGDKFKIFR